MSTQKPRRRERTQPDRLSKDTVFSILSNRRRRHVLRYLRHNRGSASLRDLAERIATWENDVPVDDLTYKQRKRVYSSLHQTHLPKLDEAGVVDYDRSEGTVTMADRAADLDAYLRSTDDRDISWPVRYLGLSAAALLLLPAAWLNVVPGLVAAGVIVVVFTTVAVANARVVS
jgi:DNA-binding transcriptional ArsR family regulator